MPANYVLLAEQTLSVSTASVTLSNIPQTGYTDLKIVLSSRNASSGIGTVRMGFNGSTASNYNYRYLQGTGTAAQSSLGSNAASTANEVALMNGNTSVANTFSNTEIYIPNYTSSDAKSWSADSVEEENGVTAYVRMTAGRWALTNAISSITFTPDAGSFAANSTFSIYGIAALGTEPVIAPKATGGDIITNDGTYWYHAFLSSGVFTPSSSLSCDALVIAGGGGGGSGGGGAGGLTAFTSQSLIATNYPITVGSGGTASTGSSNGTLGNDSQFAALTLIKGGGWGSWTAATPTTGGSGGGAAANTTNFGSGTVGQGNNGGPGIVTNAVPYPAGGGGGAGTAGVTPANTSSHGNGGAGVNTYSSWASATSTGVSGFFAGGGGGGYSSGTAGTGGSGGGGAGGSGSRGTAGVANTGGGGGGGALNPPSGQNGGAGGSGIVIVRYTMA
jgi:hypothetical protein